MINYRLFRMKKSDASRDMNNFVKIYFQAKDIEEVRLGSIFRKHKKIKTFPLPSILKTLPRYFTVDLQT